MRVTVATLGVVLLFAATARANTLIDIPIPDRHHEIGSKWLVRYPNGGPPRAKVLLPDNYDPNKAYPLLVLLIGLQSHYTDWSDPGEGEIAKTAKGFPGIIVMPEGGDGWYADWWNDGRRGQPQWESYILDEVLPQVLARYRVRAARRYHALAGVSMGGLGTAYLGGRLPGFFGSIAVISGFVDIEAAPPAVIGGAQVAIADGQAGETPTDPYALYGPPNGFYEVGHNPARLAPNLEQTRVFMTTGNGLPRAGNDPTAPSATVGQAEEGTIIKPMSDNWEDALNAAGVSLSFHVHTGFHDWVNFRPELQEAIHWRLFKPVDEHPTSWVNSTVATHGQLWQFAYRFDAPPDRVVRFRRVARRLSVSGAGSPVTLTTDSGCTFHLKTPGTITIPRRACVRLKVRARRQGALTRVRVTPVVPGTRVNRVGTDASGVALLHARHLTVRAPGFATVRQRVARASAAARSPERSAPSM